MNEIHIRTWKYNKCGLSTNEKWEQIALQFKNGLDDGLDVEEPSLLP